MERECRTCKFYCQTADDIAPRCTNEEMERMTDINSIEKGFMKDVNELSAEYGLTKQLGEDFVLECLDYLPVGFYPHESFCCKYWE